MSPSLRILRVGQGKGLARFRLRGILFWMLGYAKLRKFETWKGWIGLLGRPLGPSRCLGRRA